MQLLALALSGGVQASFANKDYDTSFICRKVRKSTEKAPLDGKISFFEINLLRGFYIVTLLNIVKNIILQ